MKILTTILLLFMVGCTKYSYDVNQCVKGASLVFVINHKNLGYYNMTIIHPETSVVYGQMVKIRNRIVDNAFTKVECPSVKK